MAADKKLIRYPEERALEDVAYEHGLVPTRIFGLLLHVYSVEVDATVTTSEPFALIDRYLARGIAEAGLGTAAELADFFGLDTTLVDRALRFLTSVGHLRQRPDGQMALTELGAASMRDGVRYSVTMQDRRKLYFDAFGSRPLTRPYYESRNVTLLTTDDAAAQAPKFTMTHNHKGFRVEALAELAAMADRDRYNLPARIDNMRVVGATEDRYLPMYIVRALQPGGHGVHHLAYTQVSDTADDAVSELIETIPQLLAIFQNEENSGRSGLDEDRANRWLSRQGFGQHPVTQMADGTWQVTLPASTFGAGGSFSLSKLGSYVAIGNGFFKVWCTDDKLRRRALLQRVDNYLAPRSHADLSDAEDIIRRVAHQLDMGEVDLRTLRRMAADDGRKQLAAQLSRLAS